MIDILAAMAVLVFADSTAKPCFASEPLASPALISPSGMAAGNDDHGLVVFLADSATGWIYYSLPPRDIANSDLPLSLVPYIKLQSPSALAYWKGVLYVCDSGSRQLLSIDIWTDQPSRTRQTLITDRLLGGVAVSSDGLVAASDSERNQLIFVTSGDDDSLPRSVSIPDVQRPLQMAFASDRLHVLDNERDKILQVTESFGHEIKIGPSVTTIADSADAINSLASAEGVIYAATDRRLLLYLSRDKSTLAVPWPPISMHPKNKLLAAAGDWLFFLDRDSNIRRMRRPVPADIRLEVNSLVANQALISLYSYLLDKNLLPLRSVTLRRAYPNPLQLLVDESVLIGSGQPIDASAPSAALESIKRASILYCRVNQTCETLNAGQVVQLPDIPIRKKIYQKLRELSGKSLTAIISESVPSPELRAQVSEPSYLTRHNPDLGGVTNLSAVTAGRFFVPAEYWELTAAFPATALNRKETGLQDLRSLAPGRIFVLSKQPLMKKSSTIVEKLGPASQPGAAAASSCDALHEQSKVFGQNIDYPPYSTDLLTTPVAIGIVEDRATVDKDHIAFASNSDDPVWISLADDSIQDDQPPNPIPGNATDVALNAAAQPEYIIAHHGTHVAAIIAGRGECFSGLLPRSHLYLIDSASTSSLGLGIRDAGHAQVQTINVSQAFTGSGGETDALTDVVAKQLGMMFVVSASDDDQDYDDKPAIIPFPPVSWGDLSNVLVVTASAANNILTLPRGSVSRGKRWVDLAAPGSMIYSATTKNEFAPGTGTSQAAPQVTAAAALLMAKDCRSPVRTKARLIATAEWRSQFKDKLWGGLLDFSRAVSFSQDNILRTKSQGDKIFRVNGLRGPSLTVTSVSELYSRDPRVNREAPKRIPLQDILSIQKIGNPEESRYRVVFVDNKFEMHIILGASLSGKLKPKGQEVWNPDNHRFEATTLLGSELDVLQITELYPSCVNYPNIPAFN